MQTAAPQCRVFILKHLQAYDTSDASYGEHAHTHGMHLTHRMARTHTCERVCTRDASDTSYGAHARAHDASSTQYDARARDESDT